MYRITTMYPEDPRQPFYNPKSSEMTPLAKLYIRREKIIPQNCDYEFLQSQILDVSENTEEISRRKFVSVYIYKNRFNFLHIEKVFQIVVNLNIYYLF